MLKSVAFAALAAASVLAAAAPAAAAQRADAVRIPVAGKTFGQVDGEIRAAAVTVCGAADQLCVSATVNDGLRQYRAIENAHRAPAAVQPHIELMAGGVYAMRVSLKDKTQAQIDADIRAAAHAVCKPTSLDVRELDSCVGGAVRGAQERLQALQADASKVRQLASN